MKNRLFAAFAASALALGVGACTVDQTEEGELEMPEYEVQPADVQVDWDTTQVRTPDVNIVPDTLNPDTLTNG
jgi:hypothetical protein